MDIEKLPGDAVFRQRGCSDNFTRLRRGGGTFRRVAQQRDNRCAPEEMVGEFSRLDRDGGEQVHIGIRVQAGVRQENHAVITKQRKMRSHQRRHAEYTADPGLRFDGLQQGPKKNGGNCLIAAHQRVGVAVLHHHSSEVMRADEGFLGVDLAARTVTRHVFRPFHEKW